MSTRSDCGSTELADVDRCDELYVNKYIRGLSLLVEPHYRLLGTLIHVCLRYYYAQFLINGVPEWWTRLPLFEELERVGRGRPKLIEQAKLVAGGYISNYQEEDRKWRVLLVEEQIGVPLGEIDPRCPDYQGKQLDDDTVVTVRPDVLSERPDGVRCLRDYKGSAGDWGRLASWKEDGEFGLAWQPMEYLFVTRLRVENIGAFWIDRIKRTPPFEFDRHPLSPTPEAYQQVPRVIRRQVLKRRLLRERVAYNELYPGQGGLAEYLSGLGSYWTCWGRYGPCDFYDLCRSSNKAAVLAKHYGKEIKASL